MARELDHFQLKRWRETLPRRKQPGGGRRDPRKDRSEHGRKLDEEAGAIAERLEQRTRRRDVGVNPKLIFKLRLRGDASELDDDAVSRLGLTVVGRSADGILVVFPTDASLADLRRRLQEYAGMTPDGHVYGELDAIEDILELSSEDRIGRRLAAEPLQRDEIAALDVELWHSGNRDECRQWVREIERLIAGFDLRVTDSYVGVSICVLRAKLNETALGLLLDPGLDYVKVIDRRPVPNFEMGSLRHVETAALEAIAAPPTADAVGIVVIDSGIATAHPLLRPLVGDAQLISSGTHADTAGDVDAQTGGHGTAVAGIAAFGDLGECLEKRQFVPGGILFSARVTTPDNDYDPDYLVEHQLVDAVEYFIERYPTVHVFNISLGDATKVYSDAEYQFRFAATIDELAYRHRDREIVFVVSTGNLQIDPSEGEALLAAYPTYLLEGGSRLIDPATAAIALTVGGLSYGEGMRLDEGQAESTDRLVASERSWPSPFTRSGPGVNGCIKPELVDFAGDLRFVRGRVGREAQHAGVPTTSKDFAPPGGTLLRTVAGTSYAAPRVANLAARLFQAFPNASSNLIRALIAASAEIPNSRPSSLAQLAASAPEALRIYGYGQPDFERARWSAENDILLLADEIMELDTFALFEVASLPENFFTAKGSGELAVTLAFDPPTRHTRMDSYIGVNMEAHLFRNCSPDDVAEAMRAYAREERESLAEQQEVEIRNVRLPRRSSLKPVGLLPSVMLRKKGTLQRGVDRISSVRWKYDGRPLILAVICRRLWAPDTIKTQRFAAIVTIRHENERVLLHQHIRAEATVSIRARVRG